jgi:murein DD-endopeptidase MepM/ murein hydrolase activator NlpD
MLNMFGRKYKINPETLRVEPAKMPLKKRVLTGVIASLLIIGTAVGMRVLYDQHSKSPRLVFYEKKNQNLREAYRELSQELREDEQLLAQFQRRDDRLYRSIFGMEPIPSSIREAGTGGAARYSALNSISDPGMVIDVFDRVDKVLMKARIQSSSFEDLEQAAHYNQQLLASKPLIQPISPADPYWLTSTFGYRIDPFTKLRRLHQGIDLAGPHGLNIHATGDGVVKIAERNRYGYGNEVFIDHGFGYTSRYAHLREILVEPGEKVKRGQVIGTLGSSGRSTGPHLHYEITRSGRALNPMYYYFEELSAEEYKLITSRAAVD